jgi:hypothetical protein
MNTTKSVFNEQLHPSVCEFLKLGNSGKYLNEIASWNPDNTCFQDSLEENLSLTKSLFSNDQIFCNHLTAEKRELVMPRLSEIWLAAYLLRNSFTVERVPEGRVKGQGTPDFRLHFNETRFANLEIKRMASFPAIQVDPMLKALAYDILQDDKLKRKFKNTVSSSRKQLAFSSTEDKDSPTKILAWDIAESLDFQTLLIVRSDKALAEWIKQELNFNEQVPLFDCVLLFASGIQSAKILYPRMFMI